MITVTSILYYPITFRVKIEVHRYSHKKSVSEEEVDNSVTYVCGSALLNKNSTNKTIIEESTKRAEAFFSVSLSM
jgi:hypothetical protein